MLVPACVSPFAPTTVVAKVTVHVSGDTGSPPSFRTTAVLSVTPSTSAATATVSVGAPLGVSTLADVVDGVCLVEVVSSAFVMTTVVLLFDEDVEVGEDVVLEGAEEEEEED